MTTTYTTFSALIESASKVGKAKIEFGIDSVEYTLTLKEHESYLRVCKDANGGMQLSQHLFQIERTI